MLIIDQLQTYWAASPLIAVFLSLFALAVVSFAAFFVYLLRFPAPRKIVPRRPDHFRPDLVPTNLDTIVIGSGSGGSCCANLLAQSGQRVLVLEQHQVTGGCTHSFREQNCEWDTGLHYVPKDMSDKTARAGAVMDFMTHGLQKFQAFDPVSTVMESRLAYYVPVTHTCLHSSVYRMSRTTRWYSPLTLM